MLLKPFVDDQWMHETQFPTGGIADYVHEY